MGISQHALSLVHKEPPPLHATPFVRPLPQLCLAVLVFRCLHKTREEVLLHRTEVKYALAYTTLLDIVETLYLIYLICRYQSACMDDCI